MNIFLSLQPVGENYANPKTCFFHVLFKAAGLAMYILSALFFDSFVIIFVVMVLLAALDFWVVKNSSARMNKKDSLLFWWTLYLNAAAWVILGIFSVLRYEADYVLVVAVCASLSIANIVGFTKCRKGYSNPYSDAKKQIQGFACEAIASHFT
ncbi:hypothetical protein NC651_006799 [Populus alba x Populus x berolinensis]|nr:hypothetical protein NC651_006799 [Populus alba x Populus x berolinensis]